LSIHAHDAARDVVRAICEAAVARWIDASPNPTLLGHAAYALLFRYATLGGIGDHGAHEAACLERAFEALATAGLDTSLQQGFTGIAWVAQHLSREPPSDGDALEDVDALLLEHVSQVPFNGSPEELTDVGLYALERMPATAARRMLEQIVARIGEPEDPWATPPHARHEVQRGAGTIHALGLAHGVTRLLAFLGGAVARGVEGAAMLFRRGASWLWQQATPGADVRYCYWLADGVPNNWRWPSWCTGDPGVAGAMLAAARAASSDEDAARAIELGLHAVAGTPERYAAWSDEELLARFGERRLVEHFRGNPFLCHGTAGRMHIYRRLHDATADERFARAAREWLDATLALERRWVDVSWDETSFLYGASGLGLALLAACTPVEPRWDRLLFLS
jgi:hypothetical protein